MCHRIGRPPISTIALGFVAVSSVKRVPRPPARIATFMSLLLLILPNVSRDGAPFHQLPCSYSEYTCSLHNRCSIHFSGKIICSALPSSSFSAEPIAFYSWLKYQTPKLMSLRNFSYSEVWCSRRMATVAKTIVRERRLKVIGIVRMPQGV